LPQSVSKFLPLFNTAIFSYGFKGDFDDLRQEFESVPMLMGVQGDNQLIGERREKLNIH
jgi:hypothetical protein